MTFLEKALVSRVTALMALIGMPPLAVLTSLRSPGVILSALALPPLSPPLPSERHGGGVFPLVWVGLRRLAR